MYKMRQIVLLARGNFRRWKRNPQIFLAYGLGFVASFLLSNKVLLFAEKHDTLLQLFEPFIWTFGDAVSILLISLCLLLLFSDMPIVDNEVPLQLMHTSRARWMAGQILYLILSTLIFVSFVLVSTCILAGAKAYTANLWSDTAAILGYSSIGEEIAVPAFVKVLEFTFPYKCTLHIFALMLGYALVLSALIFYFNLYSAKLGMIAGVAFSGFGFFLTPEVVTKWFHLRADQAITANIMFGWLSPLNHATYYMHNFGYDDLPKLWMSYVIFGVCSGILFLLSFLKAKHYSFNFTGTEK